VAWSALSELIVALRVGAAGETSAAGILPILFSGTNILLKLTSYDFRHVVGLLEL